MLQNKRGPLYRSFYQGFGDATLGNFHKHWWNNLRDRNGTALVGCAPPAYQWKNIPTRATDKTELRSAELVRYSKKPYMLQRVSYRVKNASQSWATVQRTDFAYTIRTIENYALAKQDAGDYNTDYDLTYKTGRLRNIVLLNSIVQKAPDGTVLPASQTPTTRFTYKKTDPVAAFGVSTWKFGLYPLNGNYFVMDSVINPLGDVTSIEYYPLAKGIGTGTVVVKPDSQSYMVVNYQYKLRPAEYRPSGSQATACSSCTYPFGHPNVGATWKEIRMGKSYAYQTYMVVKHKRVTGRDKTGGNVIKIWKYEFDSLQYNRLDNPPFSNNFVWDYTDNSVKAGFRKVTVTGPNEDNVAGGPSVVYHHHTNTYFWGKLYNVRQRTAAGTILSNQRMNYQYLLAFDRPWMAQNPVQHPHFAPIVTGGQYKTLDMPYFYETLYESAITASKPDYLKSYFVKIVRDSTTHDTGSKAKA
jgi:hypothetical protein